jgi:hypothetical protein
MISMEICLWGRWDCQRLLLIGVFFARLKRKHPVKAAG